MGYYDDFEKVVKEKHQSPLKWVAVVVVSALVGSASTFAVVPYLVKETGVPVQSAALSFSQTNASKVTNMNVKVDDGIVQAVNKVKPAVVTVLNYQKASNNLWTQAQISEAGSGSGFIIDNQGHIVTNNHVVQGATQVKVSLQTGALVDAKVIGTDPLTDLAIIQIPTNSIKDAGIAPLGNSDNLNIGEPAIAIGNPLGSFAQTVTVGVISATKRNMPVIDEQSGQAISEEPVVQTDAAINPGNSGGPLVNINGQVVGINSAKISSSGVEGIGFAIPINLAKPIIDQILTTGKASHPALGIGGYDLGQVPDKYHANVPAKQGVWIAKITSNEAKAGGLKEGDVIVAVGNADITSLIDLREQLFKYKAGDTASITVYEGAAKKTLNVKLGQLPSNIAPGDPATGGSSGGNPGGSNGGDPSGGGIFGLPTLP